VVVRRLFVHRLSVNRACTGGKFSLVHDGDVQRSMLAVVLCLASSWWTTVEFGPRPCDSHVLYAVRLNGHRLRPHQSATSSSGPCRSCALTPYMSPMASEAGEGRYGLRRLRNVADSTKHRALTPQRRRVRALEARAGAGRSRRPTPPVAVRPPLLVTVVGCVSAWWTRLTRRQASD